MFDNLRDENSSFSDEPETSMRSTPGTYSGPISTSRRSSRFLGMTSIQRFVITLLLAGTVVVLGAACLFATGKIGF
jgi:hypothetical protein